MVELRTSFNNEWLLDWFKTQLVAIRDNYQQLFKKNGM
jgi:hypothetical protein